MGYSWIHTCIQIHIFGYKYGKCLALSCLAVGGSNRPEGELDIVADDCAGLSGIVQQELRGRKGSNRVTIVSTEFSLQFFVIIAIGRLK